MQVLKQVTCCSPGVHISRKLTLEAEPGLKLKHFSLECGCPKLCPNYYMSDACSPFKNVCLFILLRYIERWVGRQVGRENEHPWELGTHFSLSCGWLCPTVLVTCCLVSLKAKEHWSEAQIQEFAFHRISIITSSGCGKTYTSDFMSFLVASESSI